MHFRLHVRAFGSTSAVKKQATMIAILLMAVLPVFATPSAGDIVYEDYVYVDNIFSVQFHVTGLLISNPIVQLGSQEALFLSFDDLDADSKYYRYTVVHCDRNWNPSNLNFNEYVDGFEGEEFETFDRSIHTLVPFTHYSLALPNRDFNITKSGNYLLIIYIDDPEYPVITRRFMVVDPKTGIQVSTPRPADAGKYNTHHEIDFQVSTENLRVLDPKNDITAMVMQNGRWDNAYTDLHSKFERGNTLVFDYQDKIVFPTGLDFRNIDIRSTQYRSRDVFEIRRENGRDRIVLEIDVPRTFANYLSDIDINGKFVIRSTDDNRYNTITRIDENELGQLVEVRNTVDVTRHNLVADYLDVLFTLRSETPFDSDVYLFGAFTDWILQEKYKMQYNPEYQAYFADVRLKQGFYDYVYVLANSDGSADELTLEGNWYEASNDYTVLVYYSPFGGRYDELVGAVTVPSAK